MSNELIINSTSSDVRIALLEDKRLVELHTEKKDSSFSVGDIYLGKIKKLMPGLNAAFVDIGYEKDAFLHYLDLGAQLQSLLKYMKAIQSGKQESALLNNFECEPDINKFGKVGQVLHINMPLLVQVAKEPISTKGPRISSELSLPGRYVVLVPFSDVCTISQKIKSSAERTRLKRLASSIKPKNFGIIVRTVAAEKKVVELDQDIQDLLAKWNVCYEAMKNANPPLKVLGEMDRTSTVLRDMLTPNFSNIHINDPALAEEIKSYIRTIAPDQVDIVKYHKGKVSIFDHFGIDKQIKTLFGRSVSLPGGAYILIEKTEAMHVIDVNSGGRRAPVETQENQASTVNINAAREIARQLRLRDIGGIIVVDFIDMRTPDNKRRLFETLKEEMKKDSARHTILPPSKFALVQITRERVRPETQIITAEKCPSCNGSGEIKASILLTDEIENNLRYFFQEQNEKSLTLRVHPYLEAYLNRGFFSTVVKSWKRKYKRKIKVIPENAYHMLEYHFFNWHDEEIKI